MGVRDLARFGLLLPARRPLPRPAGGAGRLGAREHKALFRIRLWAGIRLSLVDRLPPCPLRLHRHPAAGQLLRMGAGGQFAFVIPSIDLVIVYRVGLDQPRVPAFGLNAPRDRPFHVRRLKGSKDRCIPWSLTQCAPQRLRTEADEPFVFRSERGGPLSPDAVRAICAHAGEQAGLGFRVHPAHAATCVRLRSSGGKVSPAKINRLGYAKPSSEQARLVSRRLYARRWGVNGSTSLLALASGPPFQLTSADQFLGSNAEMPERYHACRHHSHGKKVAPWRSSGRSPML